ncbi:helix-turn-helix transcriptional regulator [Mucilaginibacter sp. BJC16-A38]|uniref:response regulator transcription factor n=1 Tax=Mucilaginibacter phenanthrenivorans TaxID=1234842 RepID=UPI002156FA93|nr:helix-turn-helix transcriptional regulator [Mucilaginibacter phenanthrenivorans]MCR8556951.1 helix-turn-helix transcriptional regulator [Mucilaginibacter phenanthrenivorans]
MLWFWMILGLTVVAIVLLILNLKIFKKTISEKKKLILEASSEKEEIFTRNCTTFGLSAREVEVLLLILEGHTYKSAGEALFISEKTVDAHMRNVYTKVGVRNKISLFKKLYNQP